MNDMLDTLFAKYDRLVLFDTETTGLIYSRDEIIEFAAVVVEKQNGEITVVQEYDQLIALSPGGFVPPQIEQLTGISNEDLRTRGIPKTRLCCDIARMIAGNTLLLAYNAHFDLSFLFYLLLRDGDPAILKGKDKLDLLTVYKDRHSYPHKLCNAIEVYGLADKVVNSHRAVDDVLATVEVMKAMEAEKADLECYVNLFGYNPKYGVEGKPIGSVTYKPQRYDPVTPLYQL
ncbi:MAG: 3'-5' exonuclease [Oscillospiraceae bacterium]|nr:3'-5' exonuclease [Oscillospiraceae bacterium]